MRNKRIIQIIFKTFKNLDPFLYVYINLMNYDYYLLLKFNLISRYNFKANLKF